MNSMIRSRSSCIAVFLLIPMVLVGCDGETCLGVVAGVCSLGCVPLCIPAMPAFELCATFYGIGVSFPVKLQFISRDSGFFLLPEHRRGQLSYIWENFDIILVDIILVSDYN